MLLLHNLIHSRAMQQELLNELCSQYFEQNQQNTKSSLLSLLSKIKLTEITRKKQEDNLLGYASYSREDGIKELQLMMKELLGEGREIKEKSPWKAFNEFLELFGLEGKFHGILQGMTKNSLDYNSYFILMFKFLVDLSRKQLTDLIKDVYSKLNSVNNYEIKQNCFNNSSQLLRKSVFQNSEENNLTIKKLLSKSKLSEQCVIPSLKVNSTILYQQQQQQQSYLQQCNPKSVSEIES